MGLFSFIKDAGEKLFGHKDAEAVAAAAAADDEAAKAKLEATNRAAGDAIQTYIEAVSYTHLDVYKRQGLGNDWTPVRAMGSHIKGTNGESQGVVPFLKVVNDTAVAVNQGGKRKGAVCTYLESWHLDVEEFLELRKNTGDDRRRTHDMNTANWLPDLFMKRVMENGPWTLFSPSDTPDLHDLFGRAFEARYTCLLYTSRCV